MHSVGSAVGRGIFAALTTLALGAFVSVAAAQDDAVAAQAPSQILGAQRGGRRRRVEAAPQ